MGVEACYHVPLTCMQFFFSAGHICLADTICINNQLDALAIFLQDFVSLGGLFELGCLNDISFEAYFHLGKGLLNFLLQRRITLALRRSFSAVQLKLKANQAGEEFVLLFHFLNLNALVLELVEACDRRLSVVK